MPFSISRGGRPFYAVCDGGGLLEDLSVPLPVQATRSDLVASSGQVRSPFYQCPQAIKCTVDRIAANKRSYGALEQSIPSTSQFIPFLESKESEMPQHTQMVSLACSSELTWGPQAPRSPVKRNCGDCQASVITPAIPVKEGDSSISPTSTDFSLSSRATSTNSLACFPQELDAALREVRAAADRPADERPDKKEVARYVSALLKADWLNDALKNELLTFLDQLDCAENESSPTPQRSACRSSLLPTATLLRAPSTDTRVAPPAPLESLQQKCADLPLKLVTGIPSNLRSPMIHNRSIRTQGLSQPPPVPGNPLTNTRRTPQGPPRKSTNKPKPPPRTPSSNTKRGRRKPL
eukprot:GEMP01008748.1.p2 GENE.GEMP01008748.1~~GEMP01008748.1.p2  ORF type:complete len:351 (+),score=66.26 GEMP01008748.1:191-1243(+)